jgi:hypothetical protein
MQKCRQKTWHERYGLSFNMEEIASVKSLVRDLAHLGSSYSKVLLSAKCLHHFFTVERASVSVSETDLSSAAIAEARKPLSVRKWMTARCSILIPNVQTRRDVLKTSAGVKLVRATKIFDSEISEEDIVCRIQLFMMIRAHDWVR